MPVLEPVAVLSCLLQQKMNKSRVKLILWGIGGLLLIGGIGYGVQRISLLWASFQQGADPASALNQSVAIPLELAAKLEWLSDAVDTGREMEPFTRYQIETAYLQAWRQWNLSFAKGEPTGLKTYFVEPALDMVGQTVVTTAAAGWQIEQVNTRHQLKLHFYAADGSIVSFTDQAAVMVQAVWDESGSLVMVEETAVALDVVMLLEDGNWRIRHWVRRALEPGDNQIDQEPVAPLPQTIRGINYYPQATPWELFWPEYDPAVIAADLEIIRELQLNTVRIFIPFAQFGGAEVEPDLLSRVGDFLDQADENELQVIITLFDFRTDYQLLLWPQADRHLETILTQFADHPAVWAWDIKNEPDLDYQHQEKAIIDAWLIHMVHQARLYAPNQLVTIGWSSPETAVTLADQVDFVSFHYYGPAAELPNRYDTLKTAVGDKPLLLGEFGLPTWNSFFFPNGHTQPEQAVYYADILEYVAATNSLGYIAWTLFDFDHVPATVAGRWPWQTGPQRNLGVIAADETPKLAADVLRTPDENLIRPPIYSRFLKPFWLTLYVIGLMVLLFVGIRLK